MKKSVLLRSLVIATLTLGVGSLTSCSLTQSDRAQLKKLSPQAQLAQALQRADAIVEKGVTAENAATYNAAVSDVVLAWQSIDSPTKDTIAVPGPPAYELRVSSPATVIFDDLQPVVPAKKRQLRTQVTRNGIGTPFVAVLEATDDAQEKHPTLTEAGFRSPVTATLAFRPGTAGTRRAELTLHDPREVETVTVGKRTFHLAADQSAVGESILAQKSDALPGLKALINSNAYLDKIGLFSLETPNPDKIPVVLVHGLMSRPLTWMNVFNELNLDPEIAEKVQFYFFRYPSGVPVAYSAKRCRAALKDLQGALKAAGSPYSDDFMLVGHSMGGLVSKGQVQDSGDRLWITLYGDEPDDLKIPTDQKEELDSYLRFDANPAITRVVFISTPHRGSTLATGFAANIGRRLLKLPTNILSTTLTTTSGILQGNFGAPGSLADQLSKKIPTSLDNLSPESPWLKIGISLPMRPELHLHTIAGNKTDHPLTNEKATDGVVPYSSAHLDNVESELVVPSGHSAHNHPEAIKELRRIIHLQIDDAR